MTYTIGDRKIHLESEGLSEADKVLLSSHSRLFKYCLNNAIYKLLLNLKNIVHLYSDIIIIYGTLLKKIPNYEDVTVKTAKSKSHITALESEFNTIFGPYGTEQVLMNNKWQTKSYEDIIKPMTSNLLEIAQATFDDVYSTLYCIDFFFEKFDNLKKLSIPFLLVQTKSVINSVKKSLYLVNLSTIADHLNSIEDINPSILRQLRKIEKITSGFEKESLVLEKCFKTYDPSLQQYTNILLGKAILKREINPTDCQIIKRRNVCFEAAEHVISIPLSENQLDSSMKILRNYFLYVALAFALLIITAIYRLFRVLFA